MTWTASAGSAQYHLYWGDVHGHTAISDGKGDLDSYLTYARDVAKLDFVIVTDHDFGNAWPWRMPIEGWQRTQEKVEAYTVPGAFVAIAGYEWTSQPKYWTDVGPNLLSERLFPGPPKYYNHKNVYFPSPVDYLFSAKDPAHQSPDLLARAVREAGGLVQNNHPSARAKEGADQFAYGPEWDSVITNSEIGADVVFYGGNRYETRMEWVLRSFLDGGGRTGFVAGTDTHEGKPAARTAVLATSLTREAIFDALRHRRNYAVSNARMILDFRINGHRMGEEIRVAGDPWITAEVRGTDTLREVAVIRDGMAAFARHPGAKRTRLTIVDHQFGGHSYYYLRAVQADSDEHGNPSYAWSSPIWASRR